MQAWETVLLTTILSILTATITAKCTAWFQHNNEVKKWLLEKRTEIYFSFYDQVELALKERGKVFEQEYLDSLCSLKPQMKLISSKKTFEAFRNYYEFIRVTVNEYNIFYTENNPALDLSRFHQIILENGEEQERNDITLDDLDYFKWRVEKYKQDNLLNNDKIDMYIEPLYQAMRYDLGNNI